MNTTIQGSIEQMRNELRKQKEDERKAKERDKSIIHNSREDSYLYQTKQWQELRKWKLNANPCCQIHEKHGIYKPATQVHHIVPILRGATNEDRWRLLLNPDNLMSLCTQCHQQLHKEYGNRDRLDDCMPYELVDW